VIWTPIPPSKTWAGWKLALIAVVLGAILVFGISRSRGAAPTAAERACTPDAVKFCMMHVSNRANMIACLQAHWTELTPACRAVIRRKGK
jgi:hypothetical protein